MPIVDNDPDLQIVKFGSNAQSFRQGSIQRKSWTRHKNILPRVGQYRNAQIKGTRAARAKNDVLLFKNRIFQKRARHIRIKIRR
jgi:hypothetical protein